MTNDPTYDEQSLYSPNRTSSGAGRCHVFGNVNARPVPTRTYAALLPKLPSERQAVASVLAIMRNVWCSFWCPL